MIRHSLVDAGGQALPQAPARTLQYRLERTKQPGGGWRTTMTQTPVRRFAQVGDGSSVELAPVPTVARMQDDEDGTPLKFFDTNGRLLPAPKVKDLEGLAALAGTQIPEDLKKPRPAVSRPIGINVLAGLRLSASASPRRRQSLEAQFGLAVGRLKGLDRFVTTKGDVVKEALIDPVSNVTMELNEVRAGVLVSHVTFWYAPDASGGLVKRGIRTEQAASGTSGWRTITEAEFSIVPATGSGGAR